MTIRRSYLLLTAAMVILMAIGGLLFTRTSQASRQDKTPSRVRAVTAADGTPMIIPSDAIPDRVAREGNIKVFSVVEGYQSVDLQSQLADAELIVEGELKSASARLEEDDSAIYTDFKVGPFQVLLGTPLTDTPGQIIVSIRGGKLQFPNGTAEFVDQEYPTLPEVGHRYVLLLKTDPRFPGTYYLLAGSQSAFRIVADKVLPAARPTYPLFKTFLGADSARFKALIEAEINTLATKRGKKR